MLFNQRVPGVSRHIGTGGPDKVVSAVRDFAHEEFGLKHRYTMVLHTDEPHPHVHVAVKAISESGARLNIRKATLRAWRQEFARHLRAHGVEANATERVIRGKASKSKKDGIYRAALRRDSTYMQRRLEEVIESIRQRSYKAEPGAAKLIETRRYVEQGWRHLGEVLERQGQHRLAETLGRFVEMMPASRTDRARMIERVLHQPRTRQHVADRTR